MSLHPGAFIGCEVSGPAAQLCVRCSCGCVRSSFLLISEVVPVTATFRCAGEPPPDRDTGQFQLSPLRICCRAHSGTDLHVGASPPFSRIAPQGWHVGITGRLTVDILRDSFQSGCTVHTPPSRAGGFRVPLASEDLGNVPPLVAG